MRGLFLYGYGSDGRNARIQLDNPRPVEGGSQRMDTGNAGLDGYTVLGRPPEFGPYAPSVPTGAED